MMAASSSGGLHGGGLRLVFLRDMVLPASIGVYAHERTAPQRIRVNVDLAVAEAQPVAGRADELDSVLNYETIVTAVRDVVLAGHVKLVETLAERIAFRCMEDGRVQRARVRVEKLDVFPDLGAVGVEIERDRASCPRAGIDS